LSNILLDAHIFRKLTGEYSDLFDCISSSRDTIILSSEIEDEYQGKLRPTYLGFISYRNEINKKCDLRDILPSRIESRFKRYKRKLKWPKHTKDHKWVKTAISEQVKYIISNDPHLSIPPFRTNSDKCEVISPEQYIQEICP